MPPKKDPAKSTTDKNPKDANKKPADPKAGKDVGGARGPTDAREAINGTLEGGWSRNAGDMPLLAADKYAQVNIPPLAEFDPENIKLDATVIAVGKRRTGKSWAFRHIMHTLKDQFHAGIVISQTDEMNGYWRQYIPEKYIFPKFDPAILEAVFARQKAILKDPSLTEKQREEKARFFILLDDVISDNQVRYDPSVAELFVAGRHYKLFVMITTQYAKAITPTLRSNADYVLMLHTKQELQREALWRDFGDFMTKEGFFTLLDAYTEDNEILVLDASEPTAKPWDVLYWFKAQDPGAFKIGSAQYWASAKHADIPPPEDSKLAVHFEPRMPGDARG